MTTPAPRRSPRPLSLTAATRAAVGAALGLAVAVGVLFVRRAPLGEALERPLVDLRTRAFVGARRADPSVVIVTVEDPDVAAVKRDLQIPWPWPLDVNAAAFGLFARAKAKAVLVDVLHLDRGQGADDFASSQPLTEAQRNALVLEEEGATAYGAALGGLPSVVALEVTDTPTFEVPARRDVVVPRLGTEGLTLPPRARRFRGANLPVRRVAEGARAVGCVSVFADADGVFRRAHVVAGWDERVVASLALAGLSVATGASPRLGDGAVSVGGHVQRLNEDGSFLVDFRGPSRTAHARVTASKVLEWAQTPADAPLPPEALAALGGKIVIWGVNLAGAKDMVATPTEATFDGPAFQATVLDNLLHGDGRVRVPAGVDVALLLGLGAGVGAVTARARRRWVPVAALATALGAVGAAGFLLFGAGRVLDLGAPAVAAVLAWAASTVFLLRTEGRYNKWLEGAFGMYLAPSVVETLKSDPSLLALGGAKRDVTVLFSDVAGFSGFSRRLGPENLVRLLNAYLSEHGDAIHAESGTLSKFIGDAVMAVYGDPVPQPDQAVRACRTALDVQRRLPVLAPVWEGMGLTSFEVRIGVNSGPAVVGNLGSRQRFDYTSMGETVNLASRLEGANKYFGTRILLGPQTHAMAADAVLAKRIGRVVVVGWDEPEPVYELVAMRDGASADLVAHVAAWDRATAAMAAGDLRAAAGALAEAERLRPGDGACAWLRGVLGSMEAGTTPSPWSGVVKLEGKG